MRVKLRVLVGVAAAISAASGAGAAVVASDSYLIGANPPAGEYVSGTALRNQPANLVNQGFVNGPYASGSGTSNFTATSGGLNSSVLNASNATSGKVNWIGAPIDAIVRSVARNLTTPVPASGTYWISHVANRGGITAIDPAGWVLTGFGNTVVPAKGVTGNTLTGLFAGFAPNTSDPALADLVIRYRDTAATNPNATANDVVLLNGAAQDISNVSHTVIMKVDLNVAGGQDAVTWFLNPADGTSEAALASSAAATGNFSGFPLQTGADFVRLNYTASKWQGTAFFDEARLSTDLAGLSLVPEPAGLAMAAFWAGLGGPRRRRRVA